MRVEVRFGSFAGILTKFSPKFAYLDGCIRFTAESRHRNVMKDPSTTPLESR